MRTRYELAVANQEASVYSLKVWLPGKTTSSCADVVQRPKII